MDDQKDVKEPLQEIAPKPVEAGPVLEAKEPVEAGRAENPVEDVRSLKASMEKLELDDSQKISVQASAKDLQALKDVQEKVKKLLEMAKQKGVIYAVHVAKGMDDPYIVDALHDALVENGLYKQFLT